MKILCVSDHIDPLVYSVNAKERFNDVGLVLSAGDIPMSYLGFIASTLNRQILFVFGNHNLKCFERFAKVRSPFQAVDDINTRQTPMNYFGATYIGGRIRSAKGLLIAGLGGSVCYNHGKNQYTEFQMFLKMLRLIPQLLFNRLFHGRYLDILLAHSPPINSMIVMTFRIEDSRPFEFLCGSLNRVTFCMDIFISTIAMQNELPIFVKRK